MSEQKNIAESPAKIQNLKVLSTEVFFGNDFFPYIWEKISALNPSAVLVLTDYSTRFNVWRMLKTKYDFLKSQNNFPIYECSIPQGEKNKNLKQVRRIWDTLLKNHVDRNGIVINLGGGMITDIGGFAAATYKRGIRFVNVPTSLLAQVDASLGGKTGIDFRNAKNQIGLFINAEMTFIDTNFLRTLPKREFRSAFAEILKYGLIYDKNLWEKCKDGNFTNESSEELMEIIFRCCEIKKEIVEKDFYEKKERKYLNFGHTMGHVLESLSMTSKKNSLLHGEAIAWGMLMEANISNHLGLLSENETAEIEKVIMEYNFKKPLFDFSEKSFLKILHHDKKSEKEKLKLTLLEKIGKAKENVDVGENLVLEILNHYKKLDSPAKKK